MYFISKNRDPLDAEYSFGIKEDFLRTVRDNFEIIKFDSEWIEIGLGKGKAVIYYASEYDESPTELEKGAIFIDTFLDEPLNTEEIKSLLGNFLQQNKAFLFMMGVNNDSTVLVLK